MLFLFHFTLNTSKTPSVIRIYPRSDPNMELSRNTLQLVTKSENSENYFSKIEENGSLGSTLKSDKKIVWKNGDKLSLVDENCKGCFWSFVPMPGDYHLIGTDKFCWKKDGMDVVLADCPVEGGQKSMDENNKGGVKNEKTGKDSAGTGSSGAEKKDAETINDKGSALSSSNKLQENGMATKSLPKDSPKKSRVTDKQGPESNNSDNSISDKPKPADSSQGKHNSKNSITVDENFLWKIKIEESPTQKNVNQILERELERDLKFNNENPGTKCGADLIKPLSNKKGSEQPINNEIKPQSRENEKSDQEMEKLKTKKSAPTSENSEPETKPRNGPGENEEGMKKQNLNKLGAEKQDFNNKETLNEPNPIKNELPKIDKKLSTATDNDIPIKELSDNIDALEKTIPLENIPQPPTPINNPAIDQVSKNLNRGKKKKLSQEDIEKFKKIKEDMGVLSKTVQEMVSALEVK